VQGRALVSYDPNVRLNVEPALQRWRDTLAWMVPRTQLLKVSEEDLGLLFPGTAPAELARGWLAQGVALVVVTRGGEGVQAWTAQTTLALPAERVAVIDTVGAGDTYQAALLTALAERDRLDAAALRATAEPELRAVLQFAARAAAITCSRRGADLPRRAELG
jgi:fructokinase